MNSIWRAVIVPLVCHSLEEYSFTCVVVDREFIKGSVEIVIYATSGISVHAENLDSEESLFTWQATGLAKGNYLNKTYS